VLSSVGEDLIGADDEVPDGAADQHLARAGEAANARSDVNGESPDVAIAQQLKLAGVHTGANVQAESANTIPNGDRAADRAARAVEGGEHPVAQRLDKPPPVALDMLAPERIVTFKQRAPTAIAQLGRTVG
jgi:hypothetical protein